MKMAAAAIRALRVPTLFLTHRVKLLRQTTERFKARIPEFWTSIGMLGNGDKEPKFITVATAQTIQSLLKRDPAKAKELLGRFQFLILDEAHRSGASYFHEAACLCRNAYYRMMLTATPFMKENPRDDMMLKGISGEIVAAVSISELVAAGVLAKPYFKFLSVNTPDLSRLRNAVDIYEQGIVNNAYRNALIVRQTRGLRNMGKKTLVIVSRIAHGRLLEEAIRKAGVRVAYCDGGTPQAEQDDALAALGYDGLDAIVATNIFDEGIDSDAIATGSPQLVSRGKRFAVIF